MILNLKALVNLELFMTFEEGLETVIFRIKTIIGAYYENQKIDYVLINSEKNSEEYIQEMLERKLKMDIQKLKFLIKR